MAKLLGKLKDGRELYGAELQNVEVKALGDHEIEMIGSTQGVDRDNEVLSIEGWDLKNYKKNPVVLEAHNYWAPAIGRAKVRIEGKQMIFRIEFPPEGVNPRADIYRKLYKLGFMKASSVGFIPQEYKMGEKPNEPRRTFLKQELTEISLVTVPANPEALLSEKGIVSAQAKGVLNDADMNWLKELVQEVAANVDMGKAPEGAEFKAVATPFDDDDEKKVVEKQKTSDTESVGAKTSLKELLEKEPEVMAQAVAKAIKAFVEGEEFKDAVAHALTEIREDKKYRALVLGDSEETPKKFALDGTDLTKAIKETAQEVLK